MKILPSILLCWALSGIASAAQTPSQRWLAAMARDAEGFTVFPRDAHAKIIHISNHGDDSDEGTERKPVKTLGAAIALVENHTGAAILFHRGETFDLADVSEVPFSGASAEKPFLLGAYGDVAQPRPILLGGLSFGHGRDSLDFLAIQSLDFYADQRDPAKPDSKVNVDRQEVGINIIHFGHGVWIEDCRVRLFHTGLVIQSPEGGWLRSVILRRNQILDSFDGKSQGMYAQHVDDLLIDENLSDHNGWNTAAPTGGRNIFSHNFYLQDGNGRVIFTNNLSANASSHGCQQRSGGIQTGNIFYRDPLGSFVAQNASLVSNNVYDGTSAIDEKNPRGNALEIIGCDAEVSGNIFCNKIDPINAGPAVAITPKLKGEDKPAMRVSLHDNVVINWTGGGLKINGKPLAGLSDLNNDWTGASAYLDPSRDLDGYAKSIGLKDANELLEKMRDNRLGHWDDKLTPTAANAWIRAGFAKK